MVPQPTPLRPAIRSPSERDGGMRPQTWLRPRSFRAAILAGALTLLAGSLFAQDAWEHAVRLRDRLEAVPPQRRTQERYEQVLGAFRAIYHQRPTAPKAPAAVAAVADLLAEKGRVPNAGSMHMHAPTTTINIKCLKLNQAAVADCWHAFSSQNAGLSINIYNAHPHRHCHCQTGSPLAPIPATRFSHNTTNIFFRCKFQSTTSAFYRLSL